MDIYSYWITTKLRRIMALGPERLRVEYTGQVWHVDADYGGPTYSSWTRLASSTRLRQALREAYEFASENSG